MPVLRFKPGRVEEVLRLSLKEALEVMERLKIETEVNEEGNVVLELEVDRPDMYLLEGIARQVDGLLGRAKGAPTYNVKRTDYTLYVEEVPSRPCIVAGIVWDVNVDEDFLEELIQFQEKLHLSLGEKRRRFAIGLHDLDKVPSRQLYYRFPRVDEVRFKPLHHTTTMSLREVLESTEQGREYGSLALAEGRHPVIFAGDEVISVPPVINADVTRIEPGTRHILIDVTGTDCKAVNDAMRVLAFTLAERSTSRSIGLVKLVKPGDGESWVPEHKPVQLTVSVEGISGVLGVNIAANRLAELIEAMRFDVQPAGEGRLLVTVPPYRIDVMGEVDIAEEVALALGLDSIGFERPKLMLRGRLLGKRVWERTIRKLLVGYGFVEVKTFTLVSCRQQQMLGVRADELVVLENPSVVEADCFRATMLPSFLSIASRNTHVVPLRVFEVGDTARVCRGSGDCTHPDRRIEYRNVVALMIMDNKVGYEDIQAIVYGLVRLTGDSIVNVREYNGKPFIPGRAASVTTGRGLRIVLGEITPEILEEYNIIYPVAYAEIDYTALRTPAG
jgi:phenylalanyl-tRNA synthetase beta chain